jgi:hypothetical protein
MKKDWTWQPPNKRSRRSSLSKRHEEARKKVLKMHPNMVRAIAEGRDSASQDWCLKAEATKLYWASASKK